MAKEFETETTLNPAFFKAAKCRECGSVESLQLHQFKDIVLCLDCVNDLLRSAEVDESENYYTDRSYSEIAQERNE